MTSLTNAPTLDTERLLLRGPEKSDLPAFTHFLTTSRTMKAQGETATTEQAWYAFMTGIGHWHWHGFGFFTLVEKTSGQPMGRVGLLKHSDWPEIELAWHLFEEGMGHGYATEAAHAVTSWAATELGLTRLVSYIDRSNTRSQAVAKRLGASTDGARPPHEPEAEIWVHLIDPN